MIGDLVLSSAADVDAALLRMYGADLARSTGVVHVAAVWQAAPDRLVTIAIGEDAPASAHDFFALQAARARADAIITTGQILRAEPALTHDLQGAAAPGLTAWRRERLGKQRPPILVVLTSGRDLLLAHPALHGACTPLVFTSHAGAASLPDTAIPILSVATPDIHAAIAHLRAGGCRTILIEAGPSAASALYRPPVAVDELLLSVFHGALPERAQARDFVSPELIRAYLPHASPGLADDRDSGQASGQPIDEPSGPWQFLRFLRDPRSSEKEPAR